MKCEKIQNSLVDYIENNLSEKEDLAMKAHIETCNNCQVALTETREFISEVSNEELEQPSENLRINFENMLADEKHLQQTKIVQLKPTQHWKYFLQIAATILLVLSSFFFGRYQNTQQLDAQVAELKIENLVSKQHTILALMDNQSASKRIQGVQYVEEFTNLDPKIVEALVKRMLHDENTNVRLTAVNALQGFITSEEVKDGFIKALETEKDPAIQITLIQSLVKIQSKKALKPMQQLLEQDETQPFVKEEIKLAFSTII
jgi:hypothetical protein